MNVSRWAVLCVAAASVVPCVALAATEPTEPAAKPAQPAFSSSLALPEAPAAPLFAGGEGKVRDLPSNKPFSAVAVAVKVGVDGIGFDLATPLSRKWNLRGGASFFGYSLDTDSDGLHYSGTLHMRSVALSGDFFPWAGAFHVSPGITLYNGNHVTATVTVPGGSSFDVGDATYYSSNANPLHGDADITFGNKVAPRLTVGWGNMLPRKGGHWSVPFEVGVEYIDQPHINLNLAGTACTTTAAATCTVNAQTDPNFQANKNQEQNDLNSDLSPLQAYPIVSIGLSYKFGH